MRTFALALLALAATARSTYKFSRHTANFKGAMQWCSKWGGKVVHISSLKEQKYLHKRSDKRQRYWIGLNDVKKEKTWRWATRKSMSGSKARFTYWNRGEPNNYGRGEDCTQMNSGKGGRWNDMGCNARARFICEKYTSKRKSNMRRRSIGAFRKWKKAMTRCWRHKSGRGNCKAKLMRFIKAQVMAMRKRRASKKNKSRRNRRSVNKRTIAMLRRFTKLAMRAARSSRKSASRSRKAASQARRYAMMAKRHFKFSARAARRARNSARQAANHSKRSARSAAYSRRMQRFSSRMAKVASRHAHSARKMSNQSRKWAARVARHTRQARMHAARAARAVKSVKKMFEYL